MCARGGMCYDGCGGGCSDLLRGAAMGFLPGLSWAVSSQICSLPKPT